MYDTIPSGPNLSESAIMSASLEVILALENSWEALIVLGIDFARAITLKFHFQ